jgi:hypothetical protein
MSDKLIEEMLGTSEGDKPTKARKPKAFYITNANLYINTFNHTIDTMKKAGIACEATQTKTADFVEYVVRIPLR